MRQLGAKMENKKARVKDGRFWIDETARIETEKVRWKTTWLELEFAW